MFSLRPPSNALVFLETAFRFSPKHPCTLDWLVADCTNRARNTVQTIFASDSQKEENKQKHISIILFLKVSRCLLSSDNLRSD